MADHVTKCKHPEDPQFGFLTIVAKTAVKEKKDLIAREYYWMCKERLEHSTERQEFKELERERERDRQRQRQRHRQTDRQTDRETERDRERERERDRDRDRDGEWG